MKLVNTFAFARIERRSIMKKTVQIIPILLAIALIAGCLAGCGSTAAPSAAAPSNAEAGAASEAAAEEAPADNPIEAEAAVISAEEPEADQSAVEEPAEELPEYDTPEGNITGISFPLEDSRPISFWAALPLSFAGLNSAYDIFFWQEIAERTNIDFELISAPVDGAAQQFSLLQASGDLADLIQGVQNYADGGANGALASETIIDCAPYLKDYIPNLYRFLYDGTHEELLRNILTDTGALPSLDAYHINKYPTERGLVIRQDWLDQVGMEAPGTIDEMHDVLTAFKDQLGISGAMWIDKTGIYDPLTSAYGIVANYNSAFGGRMPFYVDHGTVKYGHLEQGFRDYLETISGWYGEGLIYPDFPYAATENFDQQLLLNDKSGLFQIEVSFIESYEAQLQSVAGSQAVLTPIPAVTVPEYSGQRIEAQVEYANSGWAVSGNCEDLDLVLTFCNYLYSEEGSLLCNWGVEGYTFEYDAEGNPEFTDLILSDPRGLRMAMMSYLIMGGPYLYDNNKWINSFSDRQLATIDVWTNEEKTGVSGIPAGVTLTTEESEQVSSIMSDIITYSGEVLMNIEICASPMAEYDTFCDTIRSMGVEDAVAIYQAAYDRYLSRG